MSVLKLAKRRYSARNYMDRKVEPEKLEKILEAGRVAPTAANCQPQRVLVVQSGEGLEKLSKGATVFGAPLALIVCCDKDAVWVRPYDGKDTVDVDASIITDHMMLKAVDLGLDTLWMTYFKPEIVRAEFDIPENYELVNILLIGYNGKEALSPERHDRTRKALSETVFFEHF